jgi:hypothetical protein
MSLASGARLTSGDENPASTRNTGFSLCFSCVTDFSLSACAFFFNGVGMAIKADEKHLWGGRLIGDKIRHFSPFCFKM